MAARRPGVTPFARTRIFVTGHTGFKGAWLCALLRRLGAAVTGYALAPPTHPSLFEEAQLGGALDDRRADVRDAAALEAAMRDARPDAVVHLAAQSLVLEGLADPAGTYATNVMGTVNVLEAVRAQSGVRCALIVTSDKCYAPSPDVRREEDPLGGDDPYSASKAAAEMAVEGYRATAFANRDLVLATARAGNVVGGGDWAAHRLVPDLARAMLADGAIELRHPGAVRPWQHVLDALAGYLAVLARGLAGDERAGRAWNFGPRNDDHLAVSEVVELFGERYGRPVEVVRAGTPAPENPALRLDSGRARRELGWEPLYDSRGAIAVSAQFYRRRAAGEPAGALLEQAVDAYLASAKIPA